MNKRPETYSSTPWKNCCELVWKKRVLAQSCKWHCRWQLCLTSKWVSDWSSRKSGPHSITAELLASMVYRSFGGIITIWSLFGQTLYSNGSEAMFVLIWEVSIDRLQTGQIVSQRLSTQMKGNHRRRKKLIFHLQKVINIPTWKRHLFS